MHARIPLSHVQPRDRSGPAHPAHSSLGLPLARQQRRVMARQTSCAELRGLGTPAALRAERVMQPSAMRQAPWPPDYRNLYGARAGWTRQGAYTVAVQPEMPQCS